MSRSPTARTALDPARLWRKLSECLRMRIRLERRALGLRIVFEPAITRPAAPSKPTTRKLLPPLPSDQMFAAHCDLRVLLDRAPAARRVWPSLALLERVLGSGEAESIHRVEACVLRHAARCLDQLGDDSFSPGLVALRRRIELVLRRKHGDQPTHRAWMPLPSEATADYGDSLTDFIVIDRFQFAANGLGEQVRAAHATESRRQA